MFKQKYRKLCLSALMQYHNDSECDLMADRIEKGCYYGVWRCGDLLIETFVDGSNDVRMYEYTLLDK